MADTTQPYLSSSSAILALLVASLRPDHFLAGNHAARKSFRSRASPAGLK